MDFNSLPEPWDVQIFYDNGTWVKPARCKSIYMHLRGPGGSGGAGESGPAGTKRAGGSGGVGGWINNLYGPSIFFDDIMFVSPGSSSEFTDTRVWFASGNPQTPEFRVARGRGGNPGAGGVGGAIPSYASDGVAVGYNVPMGILRHPRGSICGRSIDGNGALGGYSAADPTNPKGGNTLGIFSGAGGAGITDTFINNSTNGTLGGNIVTNGGQGNGLLASPTNIGFLNRVPSDTTDGAPGQNGTTAWAPGKPVYLSIGGAGGNGSVSGTGGKGGDGGIGCGGGGGGAGVTGGAGGRGGNGVVIILSW